MSPLALLLLAWGLSLEETDRLSHRLQSASAAYERFCVEANPAEAPAPDWERMWKDLKVAEALARSKGDRKKTYRLVGRAYACLAFRERPRRGSTASPSAAEAYQRSLARASRYERMAFDLDPSDGDLALAVAFKERGLRKRAATLQLSQEAQGRPSPELTFFPAQTKAIETRGNAAALRDLAQQDFSQIPLGAITQGIRELADRLGECVPKEEWSRIADRVRLGNDNGSSPPACPSKDKGFCAETTRFLLGLRCGETRNDR